MIWWLLVASKIKSCDSLSLQRQEVVSHVGETKENEVGGRSFEVTWIIERDMWKSLKEDIQLMIEFPSVKTNRPSTSCSFNDLSFYKKSESSPKIFLKCVDFKRWAQLTLVKRDPLTGTGAITKHFPNITRVWRKLSLFYSSFSDRNEKSRQKVILHVRSVLSLAFSLLHFNDISIF